MTKKKILIATGGTGGHIFPAYSLANYFISNNYNVKVSTDKRGYQFLKDYKNIDLIKIPAKPFFFNNLFQVLFSTTITIFSVLISLYYLAKNRPSIIIGMGGYSSFPICIAASILRIRFAIYESNLIIGKANKYLLPFTKKIFVSYKDIEGISKKYRNKVIEIGNLIREEILNSSTGGEKTEINNLKILVLGGSQGAKVFAVELPKIFKKCKESKLSIEIFQQCQINQNESLSQFYKNNNIPFQIFNFTDKIINYYRKSDLVITRSGASVLGELINVKIPFISIPLPSSADNHQFKNAEFYEKKGYGYLLEEKDIKNKLFNLINSIFRDKSLLKGIKSNQRQYSDKDIFKNLNIEIEKILNEKN